MITGSIQAKAQCPEDRCWVLQLTGCDEPICRHCSELEKARIAATWTIRHRAELASGVLLPGKPGRRTP